METKELVDGVEDLGMVSDINIIPFIDIMLVLLIIFMVTAPLMLGGVQVNLPKSGGTPMAKPENPAIVSIDSECRVFVEQEQISEADRRECFKRLARDSESGEVYVRGDGEVKYAKMMELMGELGEAGFARVTLVTDVRLPDDNRQQIAGQDLKTQSGYNATESTGPEAGNPLLN